MRLDVAFLVMILSPGASEKVGHACTAPLSELPFPAPKTLVGKPPMIVKQNRNSGVAEEYQSAP
jgi:hypothetical protein